MRTTNRRKRRRGDIRRIRQRNRRVLLVCVLACFIVCMLIINMKKLWDKANLEAVYSEQQVEDESRKGNTKQKTEEKTEPREEEPADGMGQKTEEPENKLASEEEKKQWYLRLVNADHPMTEADVPEVATETVDESGYLVDKRIVNDLAEMFKAARKEGLDPMICSAFRAWDTQVSLYENKISRVMAEDGLNEEEAAVKAATVVAKPGTSEHQVGLALDIVSREYQELDDAQMDTPEQKWLMENSWKYGFILRYPVNKSDITGVIFEPWHYRYVGKEAAKEITEQDITLEEYVGAEAVETAIFSTETQE